MAKVNIKLEEKLMKAYLKKNDAKVFKTPKVISKPALSTVKIPTNKKSLV